MASFINNMAVNTAITDNTKLDLGHVHITTANFMQLNPVMCKEMVPGEKCDVNLMTVAKLQPLAVPTFGRANIKERAFFVPMRTIWRGWNDFITDTPHVYSGAKNDAAMYSTCPVVSNEVLSQFFLQTNVSLGLPGENWTVVASDVTSSQGTSSPRPYDILGYYGGASKYMQMTVTGRQCLKIFESLGYKIVFDERNADVYSAMPLLALAKIYVDWYFPSQYVNTGLYTNIVGILNYDGSQVINLTLTDLQNIMSWITYVNYDSDYFVNAWDNPVAPNSGVYSNFTISDITIGPSQGTYGPVTNDNYYFGATSSVGINYDSFGVTNEAGVNGTPMTKMDLYSGSGSSVSRLGMSVSDYQHTALKALTDYMKRHQLVGARAMDRYLARFGKQLNSEQLNRSNYIASKLIPLQVGEVTSTSATSNVGSSVTGLGQFAGKGMAMNESFTFDWSTNEYGFLIVMSSIVPAAGIYQGLDRKVMHINKTDFWTPEFDNLGVQAISTRELYNNYDYTNLSNSSSTYMGFNETVFGFAPRYGEYKCFNDQLTGDFVCASIQSAEGNAADNSWHLMRTFNDKSFYDRDTSTYNYGNLVHSRKFMQGFADHNQYNRIFTFNDAAFGPDTITMVYNFDMVSFAPMKPLYETYDFEDQGKQVKEESGGVKLN